jgi:acetyl-CoA carboxylase carboxyltransferase component
MAAHFMIQKLYGITIVCGWLIRRISVGILANNGILFSDSNLKATRFIELCEQRKFRCSSCKILRLMVGKTAESGGIAKDGAKMVTAVATCSVPKSRSLSAGRTAQETTGCADAPIRVSRYVSARAFLSWAATRRLRSLFQEKRIPMSSAQNTKKNTPMQLRPPVDDADCPRETRNVLISV